MQVPGVNQVKVNSPENILPAMINNPDLNPADRDLIQRFMKKEVPKQKLLDRYSSLLEEQIKKYDGKVNLTDSKLAKQIAAFAYALECLAYQGKIEAREIAYVSKNVFKKYLKPEDKELIDKYEDSASHTLPEWRKARQAIIERILSYQDEMDGAIWGTSSKVEAYQRSVALRNFAPDSISEDELTIVSYLKTFGLPAEPPTGKKAHEAWISSRDFIKKYLLPLENAISSPEMIDDQEIKAYLKDSIKSRYADLLKYLQSKELDADDIDQARTMVAIFIGFAMKMGISQKEFEAIKTELENAISKPEVKQINLQEIKRPVVVTPETLPRSVIHFLEKVEINGRSGYQFVKENVKYIILNPQIKSSGSEAENGGESPAGITPGFLPVIEIDVYDEYNKAPHKAIELIDVIIHETFHVYWMKKHFNDPKMLSKAINEGVAYLAGLTASRKLLELLLPGKHLLENSSIEVINNLEKVIKSDLATIGGAIQELGLNPKEVLSDISLPKFLMASLKGNYENDTETYPILTPYTTAQSYLMFLSVPEEEKIRLSLIFEGVIKGKGLLFLDEKEKRSVHKLFARIEPRYGKMKYDEVIKELRRLYGYYAWKDQKHNEEIDYKSARANLKDISIKDIENWQNKSRKKVKESIQEIKSGKRDDLLLRILVQLHMDHKKR